MTLVDGSGHGGRLLYIEYKEDLIVAVIARRYPPVRLNMSSPTPRLCTASFLPL